MTRVSPAGSALPTLIRPIVAILDKLQNALNKALVAYYRARFVHWECRTLIHLECDVTTVFSVPVRCGGQGRLKLGAHNGLGYHGAPRLGSGEMLIQPRTAAAEILVGEGNWFSNNISIVANQRIEIGSGCQIGDFVAIYDCDFHELAPATRNRSHGQTSPVTIGDNVWLGSRVMVLKGVTIGQNSVVGAASVVTRSVPPNTIVAGVPAKVVGSL